MLNATYNCPAIDLLSALEDKSIGAVITDPPFFISTGRSGGGEFSDPWSGATDFDTALSEVAPVVTESFRVIRPGGALAVMGQGLSTTLWDLSARRAGFRWMAELVVLWNTGKPRSHNFGSLHTHVNWYAKPGSKHTFNLEGGARSIYSNVVVCTKVPINERVHVSEKPVGLTNFLVSLLTLEDDIIVDPFCGSGSTLVSAAICGRPWIGSDIDDVNCSISLRRAQQHELEEPDAVYLWINGRLERV